MFNSEAIVVLAESIVDRTRVMEEEDVHYNDVLFVAVKLIDNVMSANAVLGCENTHELLRNITDVSKSLSY